MKTITKDQLKTILDAAELVINNKDAIIAKMAEDAVGKSLTFCTLGAIELAMAAAIKRELTNAEIITEGQMGCAKAVLRLCVNYSEAITKCEAERHADAEFKGIVQGLNEGNYSVLTALFTQSKEGNEAFEALLNKFVKARDLYKELHE